MGIELGRAALALVLAAMVSSAERGEPRDGEQRGRPATDATDAVAPWPSFRGPGAIGVAERARPPASWDIGTERNVAWSVPIPGMGHSSPIVWGERIFLTSAVPLEGETGPAEPSEEDAPDSAVDIEGYRVIAGRATHAWRIFCLDRATGRVLWERTAHEGLPSVKRHGKSSHANATPATDGTHVVAIMGSEGLYAFDVEGRPLWERDLGRLDVGFTGDTSEEWGPASSPIIHDGLVIVQNDRHHGSFVAAFDVATGEEVWRAARDELPAWSTPVIHSGEPPTLVTNSPRFIRGHDPATGEERWRIADGAEVKVVTPVASGELVIVTGGYPQGERPILAIRPATGELAWKLESGSSYTPTPLVYDGVLYVCRDNGVLAAYDARTGKRLYRRRLEVGSGGFSASAVAAAGQVYFTSEDGAIYVVRAGREFELLTKNEMPEVCLATPAVSGELLLVRTRSRLFALGRSQRAGD